MLLLIYIILVFIVLFSINTICMAKTKYGFFYNQYFFSNVYWSVSIILALFFSNYYTPVNLEVYLVFFTGMFFFNFTIYFIKSHKEITIKKQSFDLRKRRIIEIFILITLIPAAYTNYKLLKSGVGLWELNSEFWNNRQVGNYLYLVFLQNIVAPIASLLVCTCFYNCYVNKSKYSDYITIIIAFGITLLNMLISGGGRTGVAFFVKIVILSILASKYKKLSGCITKLPGVSYFILLLIAILFINWASSERGSDSSLLQVISNRMSIFVPLFNHYYSNTLVFDEYLLGASMFEFILSVILYPFKMLGLPDFPRSNEIVQSFVYLPQFNKDYNADVSAYFYYLRDFGKIGCVIGPIIIAVIYNKIYSIFRKNTFFLFLFLTLLLAQSLSIHYCFDRETCFILVFSFIYYKFCLNK